MDRRTLELVEKALLEYVERYGLTERAKNALDLVHFQNEKT
jgi:hypothetical protein